MSVASTVLLPFQPSSMSTAQLAAVSFLARYSGRTHTLYTYQLKRWIAWCEGNGLDPLIGIQRAHVELYIRGLGDAGLMDSSINTMMHAVRGFFRFAHVDGLISADPAVYARLPKVQRDESRTQVDRLELIRFLQVAQTHARHCEVEVQLHGDLVAWPGRSVEPFDLLEGELPDAPGIDEDEPVRVVSPSVDGRLVALSIP